MIQALQPVLMARDVPQSVAFFQRLGFSLVFADDPEAPQYAAVARDGFELHLQWQDASQWQEERDRPTYRFLVDDVETLYQELWQAGAIQAPEGSRRPWAAPGDTPWGTREFHLCDPAGNGLQFYSLRP